MKRSIEATATLRAPLGEIREVLRGDLGRLFRTESTPEERRKHQFVVELGTPAASGMTLSQDGTIAVGSLHDGGERLTMELHWQPSAHTRLLPTFDGELVATAGQTATTRLTLTGTYEAPLGVVGRFGDGLVGHRVARESMERLVSEMAERLDDEVDRRQGSIRFRPAPYPEGLRPR